MGGGALAAPANPGPPGWLLPPYGQVERRFLRARRNELLRCEICPHPSPPARTRDPPVYPRTLTARFQANQLPSPSHHFTTSLLTISPSHHLTTSPPHHLTNSAPHHLPSSPSPHLTISPPHHLTTSPPHNLTRAAFPARQARPSRAPRPNSSTHPLCTGDRNGPLTLFLPEFSARRGGARAVPSAWAGRTIRLRGRTSWARRGAACRGAPPFKEMRARCLGPLDHTQGPRHVSLFFGSSRVGRGVS